MDWELDLIITACMPAVIFFALATAGLSLWVNHAKRNGGRKKK